MRVIDYDQIKAIKAGLTGLNQTVESVDQSVIHSLIHSTSLPNSQLIS